MLFVCFSVFVKIVSWQKGGRKEGRWKTLQLGYIVYTLPGLCIYIQYIHSRPYSLQSKPSTDDCTCILTKLVISPTVPPFRHFWLFLVFTFLAEEGPFLLLRLLLLHTQILFYRAKRGARAQTDRASGHSSSPATKRKETQQSFYLCCVLSYTQSCAVLWYTCVLCVLPWETLIPSLRLCLLLFFFTTSGVWAVLRVYIGNNNTNDPWEM
jgi:hypothetical protein